MDIDLRALEDDKSLDFVDTETLYFALNDYNTVAAGLWWILWSILLVIYII